MKKITPSFILTTFKACLLAPLQLIWPLNPPLIGCLNDGFKLHAKTEVFLTASLLKQAL
ncbi:hypothetical protein DB42_BA00030 [Neochlamydia sp. EPS4]|nr:hypothetical protein DB42_BA00030 [Neochlamydia sp. EPS4]